MLAAQLGGQRSERIGLTSADHDGRALGRESPCHDLPHVVFGGGPEHDRHFAIESTHHDLPGKLLTCCSCCARIGMRR
jgi:hypothetical protein